MRALANFADIHSLVDDAITTDSLDRHRTLNPEAELIGLFNHVVPVDMLDDTVAEEASRIRKTPGVAISLVNAMLTDVQTANGYRDTHLDDYLAILTMETEPPKRFCEHRDSEGLEAAIEWLHEADKP